MYSHRLSCDRRKKRRSLSRKSSTQIKTSWEVQGVKPNIHCRV